MKMIAVAVVVCVMAIGTGSLVRAAGPSDELARDAFKQILSQADKDKDGKLSLSECKAIYKDAAKGEKNCTFWDANKDGTITENEYAGKAMSMGQRK